jgi:DNA-binding transcriptional MerR regulator
MSDPEYDIQTLAELSGVPRRTIYFYTQQGIIPPPRGAGLGARYGEIHLLRLRLIPHLRRQGLRLDEIRQRLDGMELEAMRQLLAEAPQPGTPPPSQRLPGRVAESTRSTFVHYLLPGGCTFIAPGDLDAEMQGKVDQLIAVANQILNRDINPKGL